jgi:hypothetical protein
MSSWVSSGIVGLLTLFCVGTIASSAEISHLRTTKDEYDRPQFHIRFSGEVSDGDLERLKSLVDGLKVKPAGTAEVHLDGRIALYLNSPGGNFPEALKIIRFLLEDVQHVSTHIDANDICYSACAFIFLAGNESEGDAGTNPDRTLNSRGQLGFHAPYLDYPGEKPTKELINKAYGFAVKHIAEVIRLSEPLHIKHKFLPEILEKGPDEFLTIDTVDRLHRYQIKTDVGMPSKITPEMINNHCANHYNWHDHGVSVPSGSDTSFGPSVFNELAAHSNIRRGNFPKPPTFQARTSKHRDGKAIRYVLPVASAPEAGTAYCIVDVIDGAKQTMECVGIEIQYEDAKSAFRNVWLQVGKSDYQPSVNCSLTTAISLVPPDTPISETQALLDVYEKRYTPPTVAEAPKLINCSQGQCTVPQFIEQRTLQEARQCGYSKPRLPKDVFRQIDFNGDGVPDVLVTFGPIPCNNPSHFGMTGGPRHDLWISNGGSWKLALSQPIVEVTDVDIVRGRMAMISTMHPAYCSHQDIPCQMTIWWDGSKVATGRTRH